MANIAELDIAYRNFTKHYQDKLTVHLSNLPAHTTAKNSILFGKSLSLHKKEEEKKNF